MQTLHQIPNYQRRRLSGTCPGGYTPSTLMCTRSVSRDSKTKRLKFLWVKEWLVTIVIYSGACVNYGEGFELGMLDPGVPQPLLHQPLSCSALNSQTTVGDLICLFPRLCLGIHDSTMPIPNSKITIFPSSKIFCNKNFKEVMVFTNSLNSYCGPGPNLGLGDLRVN